MTFCCGEISLNLSGSSLTGVAESFLDATLASELNIPTQPLSIPMDVRALDVRSIGRVTYNTTPCVRDHSETITSLLTQSPQILVVLGFSWLW